jgi:hypothetical protein
VDEKRDIVASQSPSPQPLQRLRSAAGEQTVAVPVEPPKDIAPPPPQIELLAELVGTEEENQILFEAEEAAVASCMRERGFDYTQNAYYRGPEPDGIKLTPGDIETAAWTGYGIGDSIENGEILLPVDLNEDHFESLSPERQRDWMQALNGPLSMEELKNHEANPAIGEVSIPHGPRVRWHRNSCLAEARRAVYGDDVSFFRFGVMRDFFRNEALTRIYRSPSYQSGLRQWQTCMLRYGFSFEHPREARDSLLQSYHENRLAIEELRLQEIKIATADAVCYRESKLGTIHAAVQARIEQEIRSESQDTLASLQKTRAQALARAARVMAARELPRASFSLWATE